MDESICYYCGVVAEEEDHIIPKAIIKKIEYLNLKNKKEIIKDKSLTVPSCKECNRLLRDSYQSTLKKRKQELKRRLRKRYKKLLMIHNWTKTEINQLGPTLKQIIKASYDLKELIKRRIKW